MWIVALVLATLLLLLSLTLGSAVLVGQTLCASRNSAELDLPEGARRHASTSNTQVPRATWALSH